MDQITQEKALAVLHYDPATGSMTWKVARGRCAAGTLAGYAAHNGYIGVRLFGRCYYAHRIAFLCMEGRHPLAVDHINGDRSDNRWSNLREVTRSENARNMKRPDTNKSGVVGVFWNAGKGKWTARIKLHQRTSHLGDFDNLQDATDARRAAEAELGFHANHGRPA